MFLVFLNELEEKHKSQVSIGKVDKNAIQEENDEIIANLVIIHAVTTNCAKFFHAVTLNDASNFYQNR